VATRSPSGATRPCRRRPAAARRTSHKKPGSGAETSRPRSRSPAARRTKCVRCVPSPAPAGGSGARPGRGRCVSIFVDKNRRHLGKSQSRLPPTRTRRPPHRRGVAAPAQLQHVRQHVHVHLAPPQIQQREQQVPGVPRHADLQPSGGINDAPSPPCTSHGASIRQSFGSGRGGARPCATAFSGTEALGGRGAGSGGSGLIWEWADTGGRARRWCAVNDAPCPPLTSHGASIMWHDGRWARTPATALEASTAPPSTERPPPSSPRLHHRRLYFVTRTRAT
jgi:hypothetical protein